MLQLAQIKPGELVCDLGSGDGRIVISAAKDFGARAIGYELREDLVRKSREKIAGLNLDKVAKIVNADLLSADLSQVDVVTIYLNTSANEKLRPKLEKELKAGARVVSHDFSLNTWRPVEVSTTEPAGHTIYLYSSPWSFRK
ncbi:MAG: class I SAM-dependent methyltransferase [Candidatus Brockarchaeota archaeon]|nr:class I SAM-dependent methyltransferase [Candidatus Brockarchaeota archaeon]